MKHLKRWEQKWRGVLARGWVMSSNIHSQAILNRVSGDNLAKTSDRFKQHFLNFGGIVNNTDSSPTYFSYVLKNPSLT